MSDELQPVSHVVEAGERVGDDKHAVGDLQRVRFGYREAREITRRLVTLVFVRAAAQPLAPLTQVPTRPAAKPFGKTLSRFSGKCLEIGFQGAQRVCPFELAPPTRVLHSGATTGDGHTRHRVRRDERIAAELLSTLVPLEQVGGTIA